MPLPINRGQISIATIFLFSYGCTHKFKLASSTKYILSLSCWQPQKSFRLHQNKNKIFACLTLNIKMATKIKDFLTYIIIIIANAKSIEQSQ